MRSNWSLGRIAGIQIGLNWTWLVIFAFFVWNFDTSVFPTDYPGLSRNTYAAMSVAATLLFVLSLLLHELGHALVARAEGMEIDGITLWLFGGVAKFRGMFRSAGAEFLITIAGPAVSAALAGIFIGIGILDGLPRPVEGVVRWLGYINLSLLIFNLLPALPMDGGRLLRSTLWRIKGDFAWATGISTIVARLIGYAMIAGGLALLLWRGSYQGLWLSFIGWFVLQAGGTEARFAAAQESLEGLHVRDLMVRNPVTVPSDLSLGQFMAGVVWGHYASYPVVDGGAAVGLLPFQRAADVPRGEWSYRLVRDLMLPRDQVPLFDEDADAREALLELTQSDAERGLVLSQGQLVGLISISDVLAALRAHSTGPARRRRGWWRVGF
ncbi:MAG: M50 family metallopeptidase [Gaiellaceae bacterium]